MEIESPEPKLSFSEMKQRLEKLGYVFVTQDPHKGEGYKYVEHKGQSVEVPFTNMPKMQVALKKENGEWKFAHRSQSIEQLVRDLFVLSE